MIKASAAAGAWDAFASTSSKIFYQTGFMTKEYNLLFSITLQHAFYSDGSAPELELSPNRATAAFMLRYDVHARMDGNRLIVFYGKEKPLAPALAYAKGANALYFTLQCANPYFFNRTEIPFFHPQSQRLYFTNIGKSPEAEGQTRLSLENFVGAADLLPVDAAAFDEVSLPSSSLACVEIVLGREKGMVTPPPADPAAPPPAEIEFSMSFQARQAKWRYLIINKSQLVFDQIEMSDGRNPLEFKQEEPRLLSGTNYLAVPISLTSPYSILDRATLRPKLKLIAPSDNGLQRNDPTTIDLPTPDGRRIVPEMVGGAQQVYADMYVFL